MKSRPLTPEQRTNPNGWTRCCVVLASGVQCREDAVMTKLCAHHWEWHCQLSKLGVFFDYVDLTLAESRLLVRPLR